MELKPFYDAARAANDAVQAILKEMAAAFDEGTEEGQQKALDLRPALDEAKIKAGQADLLYTSMRDASSASDEMARKFVPVAGGDKPAGEAAKEMTRAAFAELDAEAQMKFMKSGGKLVEPTES